MSPDIQWHVGEDAEQEMIATATLPRRSRRSWIAILIVVMLGAGLVVAYRSIPEPAPRPIPTPSPTPQPSPTPPAIPAKLYAAIDREAQALASGDLDSYLTLQRPQPVLGVNTQTNEQCIECDVLPAWGRPTDDKPLYTITGHWQRIVQREFALTRQQACR